MIHAGLPEGHGVRAGPVGLAKWAGQTRGWRRLWVELYGEQAEKEYEMFVATWRPAGGAIRVVLVKERDGRIGRCPGQVRRGAATTRASGGADFRHGNRSRRSDRNNRQPVRCGQAPGPSDRP